MNHEAERRELPEMDVARGIWRATTIRQPWAWLLTRIPRTPGRCLAMPRPFDTKHRGPILIHAGTQILRTEWQEGERTAEEYGIDLPRAMEMPRGCIVAVAVLCRTSRATERMWTWDLGHLEEIPSTIPMRGEMDVWRADLPRLRCCDTFAADRGCWRLCTKCGRPLACSHRIAVQGGLWGNTKAEGSRNE